MFKAVAVSRPCLFHQWKTAHADLQPSTVPSFRHFGAWSPRAAVNNNNVTFILECRGVAWSGAPESRRTLQAGRWRRERTEETQEHRLSVTTSSSSRIHRPQTGRWGGRIESPVIGIDCLILRWLESTDSPITYRSLIGIYWYSDHWSESSDSPITYQNLQIVRSLIGIFR